MNRIVYLFELDSVRNSEKEIERGQRALFQEIILNGNTVVLSLNQISDSEVFLNLMREKDTYEKVMRLFELGALKIGTYKDNENEKRTVFQYIKLAVDKCLDEKNETFLFSGLPLTLKNDRELLENIKIALENSDVAKLREQLNKKEKEHDEATDDILKEAIERECEKIVFAIRYVKLLLIFGIEEIEYNPPNENHTTNLIYYIDKANNMKEQITDKKKYISLKYNKLNQELFLQLVDKSMNLLQEIKKEIQNISEDMLKNRSNWYKAIQHKIYEEELKAMSMAVVDLCYNYTVEDSIGNVSKRYINDEEFVDDFRLRLYNYINDFYMNSHDFSIEKIREYKEFVKTSIPWDTAVRVIEATKKKNVQKEVQKEELKGKPYNEDLKKEKKIWNKIIIANITKKFMVTIIYIALFCIAQWLMGKLEGVVSGAHILNGLLHDVFTIILFGILGSVVSEKIHLPDILESMKNICGGLKDCYRIIIEKIRLKKGNERSVQWMNHLKKYDQLRKERPECFEGSELINIELDQDKIIEFQNKTGKKIGVVYESEYNIVVVDLIKNGTNGYYTYERVLPTVNKGAVVIFATYNGKIVLLNQYRHAIREFQYGFPRGFGEEGISEDDNVRKEMIEELSAKVSKIEKLGEVIADSGLTSNRVSVFKCEIEEYEVNEGFEGIKEVLLLEENEFEMWIQEGKITDGFTLAAYSLERTKQL